MPASDIAARRAVWPHLDGAPVYTISLDRPRPGQQQRTATVVARCRCHYGVQMRVALSALTIPTPREVRP